jgi:hypothetical protein
VCGVSKLMIFVFLLLSTILNTEHFITSIWLKLKRKSFEKTKNAKSKTRRRSEPMVDLKIFTGNNLFKMNNL